MNKHIEILKEELINKIIELDKQKKWSLRGTGYIFQQYNNIIEINSLIGESEIDDNFASKIKLVGISLEENEQFYYHIDIFYEISNNKYEMILYKYDWQTNTDNFENNLKSVDYYRLKVTIREGNIMQFIFSNKYSKTFLVLKTQVSDV